MNNATSVGGALPVPSAPQAGGGDFSIDETRASPRMTLLIRTAKVVGPTGEWLGIIRDASTQGIRLKTFHPVPPEPEFELELPNGQRHKIIKVWQCGDMVGFRFDRPVDIEQLVAETPPHLRR